MSKRKRWDASPASVPEAVDRLAEVAVEEAGQVPAEPVTALDREAAIVAAANQERALRNRELPTRVRFKESVRLGGRETTEVLVADGWSVVEGSVGVFITHRALGAHRVPWGNVREVTFG